MTTNMLTITPTTKVELPEAIAMAYAGEAEIKQFLRECVVAGVTLTKAQQGSVRYALARDAYRHGGDLRLSELAMLAECAIDKVEHFVRRACGVTRKADDWLTGEQCNSVLSLMMEM